MAEKTAEQALEEIREIFTQEAKFWNGTYGAFWFDTYGIHETQVVRNREVLKRIKRVLDETLACAPEERIQDTPPAVQEAWPPSVQES